MSCEKNGNKAAAAGASAGIPKTSSKLSNVTGTILSRVRQVHDWFGGYLLVLADGTKLPTGRQYREVVLQRLHALR